MVKKFQCPNCGNEPGMEGKEPIEYVDWTPTHRPVIDSSSKGVTVEWSAYEDYPDAAKDPSFHCEECDHSWSTDGWSVN